MVSNGADIAVTDESGTWRLPARPGCYVFVIKPTDWSVGEMSGRPFPFAVRVGEAIDDTSIDFALVTAVEPRRFDVALLADTQPQSATELAYLRDSIMPAVAESQAAFAINHGDVVFDRPELYARYLDIVASTSMPWHHCPGNHDMDGADGHGFETWQQTFGPCHYAFQFGGATFVLLNNVDRLPDGQRTASGHDYRGYLSREQLSFVRRVLAHVPQSQLVVLSMHIPLVGWESPDDAAGMTENYCSLLELLSGRPHTVSFAGHTHTTEHHYLGLDAGFVGSMPHHHHVLTAACGSWWSGPFDPTGMPTAISRDGTPRGFHILSIDGGSYSTRLVPTGYAGHPQMRLFLDGGDAQIGGRQGTQPSMPGLCLVANIFDGGPRTEVTGQLCRARGGAATTSLSFERSAMRDALVLEAYRRHKSELKPWVEASPSSHIWQARLPDSLPAGTYRVRIAVADEYARRHTHTFVFEAPAVA